MRIFEPGFWSVAVGFLALSGPLFAADNQRLSVTIYNSNIALVQDVRSLDFPLGRSRLEFKDVSASIRPETVSLSAAGISVVEQNFDFDLLTPHKLMEKAVGQQIQLVRINPGNGAQETEAATVMSVNDGVVLKVGNHIEVLHADEIPTRVIFSKIPDNLRARPTLSVNVDSNNAGQRDATLSYLTTGLSWKADYVALLDEKAGKLNLQGWITLTNRSGSTFNNAELHLVAGNMNLVRGNGSYDGSNNRPSWQAGREAGGSSGASPIADYYIYPLPERTTIADQQTKQVGFIDANNVAAKKAYQFNASGFSSADQPEHADVVVKFSNSANTGLGAPLPAGVVRVYVRDITGTPKFVGENSIGHTPQGSDLSIKTGDAFDVTVQPTVVSQEKQSKTRSRYSVEYLVRNARNEPVTVEIRQSGLGRDGKVINESTKSKRVDAYTLQWDETVEPASESKLAFTVETGW